LAAQAPNDASLRRLYERHSWSALRDAVAGRAAPALYSGAAASALNQTVEAEKTRVRADLLAIAVQNVERRLNAMPSFLALVRQIRRSSLERRLHAAAREFSRRGKPWTSVYTTAFIATNPLKAPHLL
jgi:hypothetical protein